MAPGSAKPWRITPSSLRRPETPPWRMRNNVPVLRQQPKSFSRRHFKTTLTNDTRLSANLAGIIWTTDKLTWRKHFGPASIVHTKGFLESLFSLRWYWFPLQKKRGQITLIPEKGSRKKRGSLNLLSWTRGNNLCPSPTHFREHKSGLCELQSLS